jgi:hypothetical protein
MNDPQNIGTTGHVTDPKGVHHPSHYNNHASGIETIEVVRRMGFNLGSSMKYVWRLFDKDGPHKNACKALWYVVDEIHNGALLSRNTHPARVTDATMCKVLDSEPDPLHAEIMMRLWLADQYGDLDYAQSSLTGLQQLVERHKP